METKPASIKAASIEQTEGSWAWFFRSALKDQRKRFNGSSRPLSFHQNQTSFDGSCSIKTKPPLTVAAKLDS
jgi:hypothetical protein